MRHYTVHARSDAGPDDVRFVKDGFSWPAFFFPLVWLVLKGQWLWLVLYLLALALIGAVATAAHLTEGLVALQVMASSLLLGLEGNDIYRRSLARAGFSFLGPAAGSDLEAAELQFFSAAWPAAGRVAVAGGAARTGGEDLQGLA